MRALLSLGTFYIVMLCGCARRPAHQGVLTFVVGPECHPSAVEHNCDSDQIPHCATIALTYDKGCEKLKAK